MAFTTRIIRYPNYVQVDVAGPSSLKDLVELITTVGEETAYWSDRRVLVDLRAVQGSPTTEEQIFIGELVAQNLSHLDRMASVVPPQHLTHNSERAAQKLGTELRVFDVEAEALAWITEEVPASQPGAA